MQTRWNTSFFTPIQLKNPGYSSIFRDLERFFTNTWLDESGWKSGFSQASPKLHYTDQGTHFRLLAELPGMTLEDLTLTVEAQSLTLEGKKHEQAPEGYKALTRERGDLELKNTIKFPCAIDTEQIEAHLKNGVLQVVVPKAPESQPKNIDIKIQ